MDYPDKVMRKTALQKLGLSESFLMTAYNNPSQTFAWKINPLASGKNSPIVFDTEGLEKYRLKQAKLAGR